MQEQAKLPPYTNPNLLRAILLSHIGAKVSLFMDGLPTINNPSGKESYTCIPEKVSDDHVCCKLFSPKYTHIVIRLDKIISLLSYNSETYPIY